MIRQRYLFIGCAFGLLFPIFGLIADCFIFNSLSFAEIPQRINDNPIHYIIFLAPFVLGATFYYIGLLADRREKLNDKLSRINSAFKETNGLLDTFNYHVSHDLKTVLNNQLILAKMADKYCKKQDQEKVKEVTKKMISAAENGLTTVVNFLNISHDGFVPRNLDSTGINVKSELARVVEENNLTDEIKVTVSREDFQELLIGRKVFETIILNLLTNAIKYNDGAPEMNIELKQSQGGKHLLFKDNGIGIDLSEDKDKLFKPFNRINNQKNTEGTGIGLYLINKIVNSLDGNIAVDSTIGEGTTFTITFFN